MTGQRKKIGLIYSYNESWIAGTYYISNLIHALKSIDDDLKPVIVLFCDSSKEQEKVMRINYPYITFKKYTPEYNIAEKMINRFSRQIFHSNFIEKRMKDIDFDFVFIQRRSWETDLVSNNKKIFWIPDCQELMMPHFFSERELGGRKHVYNEIINAKSKIIFSSKSALTDFNIFYPGSVNQKVVVNFAVTHPPVNDMNIDEIKKKYNINGPYFFTPNQFWVHKNHKAIIDAALDLKEKGINATFVFTGKEIDFRAPHHAEYLKNFVVENNLGKNILFLGFIDRVDLVCLMQHAIAIIQPSLFEGWSMLVEDAKAHNKYIILSDIDVHREQINSNVVFFDPGKPLELSDIIKNTLIHQPSVTIFDYSKNIKKFGLDFVNALN